MLTFDHRKNKIYFPLMIAEFVKHAKFSIWFQPYLNLYLLMQAATSPRLGIADIVFVVDSSGSIGRSNWGLVIDFLYDFVQDLTIGIADMQV